MRVPASTSLRSTDALAHDPRVVAGVRGGGDRRDEGVQVRGATDALDLAALGQLVGDRDGVGRLAAAVEVDDRVVHDLVRRAVEVGAADLLDDVGDRVLRDHHAAEHAALGVEVLRRGPVVAAATAVAVARRSAVLELLDRHQVPISRRSYTCCMRGLTTASDSPAPGARTRDVRCPGRSSKRRRSACGELPADLWGELWRSVERASPTVSRAVDRVRICPQAVDSRVDGRVKIGPDLRLTRANAVHVLWMRERLAEISSVGHRSPGLDRQILALALPALGALVAEPLFVLVDSAVVGHLGTAPLAGLALASTILVTVIGLCVFLAYATTAAVARRLGAGDRAGALQVGVDGMWLALGLGVVLAAATWLSAPWLVDGPGGYRRGRASRPSPTCAGRRRACPGCSWSSPPPALCAACSTPARRSSSRPRAPSSTRCSTSSSSTASAWASPAPGWARRSRSSRWPPRSRVVVVRGARAPAPQLRPAAGGILANARAGAPAVRPHPVPAPRDPAHRLGGHRPRRRRAGRAPGGRRRLGPGGLRARRPRHRRAGPRRPRASGSADVPRVRAVLRRTLQWGVGAGAALGLVVGGLSWAYVPLFTADDDVRHAAVAALVVAAVTMPMAGWVFVLDGVLIGAGDGRFLAWAGMATLVVYVPFALAVRRGRPAGRRRARVAVGGFRRRLHARPRGHHGLARPRHGVDGHRRIEEAPRSHQGNGALLEDCSAQAATTLTVTVADTSACRRTDTWYSPRALIG